MVEEMGGVSEGLMVALVGAAGTAGTAGLGAAVGIGSALGAAGSVHVD